MAAWHDLIGGDPRPFFTLRDTEDDKQRRYGLDLAKCLHERLRKRVVERVRDEEHDGEGGKEGSRLDEDGDDVGVLRDVILPHHMHDLASEEEDPNRNEYCDDDVEGESQGKICQSRVCRTGAPGRRRRGLYNKYNAHYERPHEH